MTTDDSVLIQFSDFLIDMASEIARDEEIDLARIKTDGMSTVFMSYLSKIVDWLRDELNKVLSFSGLELGEDGSIRRTSAVSTLSEAEKRAKGLRNKLEARGVHPDVLKFCKAELLQNNYQILFSPVGI